MVIAIVVAGSVGVGAQPAGAHGIDACWGNGTMVTADPFYYVGFGPPASAGFNLVLSIGGCVLTHGGSLSGGPLLGHCGLGTVSIQWDGHAGSGVWAGATVAFTGPQIVGSMTLTPDALAGESCERGADQFLVSAVVVLSTT
ncbi:MAG TPA: hypothetical protein VF230_11635 [Acidimicrobiales bacterium]